MLPVSCPRPTPKVRAQPKPFVKWVGGKRKVFPEIKQHLLPFSGRYHEPFVGGGAVFFALFNQPGGLDGGASLSDGNLRLVRTWTAIRDNVDRVIQLLADHKRGHSAGGADYYYQVRAMDIDEQSDANVAAWFIYLNKAGFNGLYRVNSKNRFNVPVGRHKSMTILDEPNLLAVHHALQGVDLAHRDFAESCELALAGDAVYLDPPYVPLSRSASFTAYTKGGFGPEQQRHLAQVAVRLASRGVRVVLSNHDTPEVRKMYQDHFKIRTVHVNRNVNRDASKRGKVAEVLIY